MTALGTTVERRICKYCPAKMIRPNRDAPWVVDMIKVDPS